MSSIKVLPGLAPDKCKFALPANRRCTQREDKAAAALPNIQSVRIDCNGGITRWAMSSAVYAVLARGLKMSVRRDLDVRTDR